MLDGAIVGIDGKARLETPHLFSYVQERET
jgi:hypothetical protein